MNKKIRELAETCYTTKYNPFGADEEKYDMEKFAELIIKECANIAWNNEPDGTICELIKQEFGIKE